MTAAEQRAKDIEEMAGKFIREYAANPALERYPQYFLKLVAVAAQSALEAAEEERGRSESIQ